MEFLHYSNEFNTGLQGSIFDTDHALCSRTPEAADIFSCTLEKSNCFPPLDPGVSVANPLWSELDKWRYRGDYKEQLQADTQFANVRRLSVVKDKLCWPSHPALPKTWPRTSTLCRQHTVTLPPPSHGGEGFHQSPITTSQHLSLYMGFNPTELQLPVMLQTLYARGLCPV